MYLDAIQFKVRDSGHVKTRRSIWRLGSRVDGLKEVLGLWIAQTEGAILAASGNGTEESRGY